MNIKGMDIFWTFKLRSPGSCWMVRSTRVLTIIRPLFWPGPGDCFPVYTRHAGTQCRPEPASSYQLADKKHKPWGQAVWSLSPAWWNSHRLCRGRHGTPRGQNLSLLNLTTAPITNKSIVSLLKSEANPTRWQPAGILSEFYYLVI